MDRTLKIDDLLCFSLYSANHALTRLYRPLLAPLGLTYPQYLVLVALWEQDEQKVSDLGKRLDLETNTLTPLLKRMESTGYLTRRRNPEDERSLIVSLTDKGQALQAEAQEISTCVIEAMGGDLNELIELRDRVNALRARLDSA
ncbi:MULTISPECIES: MarR family winged helix-turn-helix transcriptional regulator [Phaeobacter]|uniref:MarR family transcriptional regulator n=1 Tax=Phaeobacter gallaeciensis TaxID=60890 RepID=A0ABD4XB21_9RHOB|nr:MarR family transcriptional regulator [Phaeobacter gallaeciensis]MDF1772968.1 MarR family transcriptional regulator [Pseudophaeobacter sp. bin_em_oilr2.035]MDE4145567.1 MarR family transcriptional regulator [Phaeobacter gallaeciensis]MDE4158238.1 MarR family transcriptional regulator [Phaeobacter gallaeciensis]MDE4162417.1 MarR family transcriptional regulator [Phaeobacter gallaeciensis]MDE4166643.1 MarR family transcriptional regulator [Phaeobacter gallaeciensis]